MPYPTRTVRLSGPQIDYLAQATYLPAELREAVTAPTSALDARRIEIDAESADALQSAFVDRLVQAGFDAEYNVTEEGAILEDLIDLFGDG